MRRSWIVVFLMAVVLALVSSRALSAAKVEASDRPEAAGAEKGPVVAGEKEGGEAPHDPFAQALDLTIWTVVVFLVLLLVLRRFAWGPMLQGLQNREQRIRESLDKAREEREAAERLRGQIQQELDLTQDRVRQMLEDARRDAQRTTEQMLNETRTQIQAERERLHREVDLARDQALQQLWNQAAQLATLISAKAIRRQLTPEDHRRLIDESLAELRQTGNHQQRS